MNILAYLAIGNLIMSRADKVVAFEGLGAAPQEGSASDTGVGPVAKFVGINELANASTEQMIRGNKSELQRYSSFAGVQKEEANNTQRHDASTDGVIRNIPLDRTHTLQVKYQQGIYHIE